jgi:hypothetical protein
VGSCGAPRSFHVEMNSDDIVRRNTAHVNGKSMVMPGTPEMPAVKYEVDKSPHTVEQVQKSTLEVTK